MRYILRYLVLQTLQEHEVSLTADATLAEEYFITEYQVQYRTSDVSSLPKLQLSRKKNFIFDLTKLNYPSIQ